MNTVFHLNECQNLFKDEQSLKAFATKLAQKMEGHEGVLLVCGDELIGSLLSYAATEERLRAKLVEKLFKSPHDIEKLTKRLESDDIVE
jgi:hypothetical protein